MPHEERRGTRSEGEKGGTKYIIQEGKKIIDEIPSNQNVLLDREGQMEEQ